MKIMVFLVVLFIGGCSSSMPTNYKNTTNQNFTPYNSYQSNIGAGTILGTIIGGYAGAEVGNKFGKGKGRTAMRIAGGILGSLGGGSIGYSYDNPYGSFINPYGYSSPWAYSQGPFRRYNR